MNDIKKFNHRFRVFRAEIKGTGDLQFVRDNAPITDTNIRTVTKENSTVDVRPWQHPVKRFKQNLDEVSKKWTHP